MDHSIVLGVDIGGSHITAAQVNIKEGALIENTLARTHVNSAGQQEEIIAAWCDAIKQSLELRSMNPVLIGIAMPGPFDYENGICLIKEQEKYQSLYSADIRKLLSEKLSIPAKNIRFINDACGFLQGELLAGTAAKNRDALGITLGTGLGSAFCYDGVVNDGDLWQQPFREGMAEDYLSTRWFVTEYTKRCGSDVKGVKDLIDKVETNSVVKDMFEEFAENLASFIAGIFHTKNFESVIIGGNIAKASPYFLSNVKANLEKMGIDAKIIIGKLGETAAMIGAAGTFASTTVNDDNWERLKSA